MAILAGLLVYAVPGMSIVLMESWESTKRPSEVDPAFFYRPHCSTQLRRGSEHYFGNPESTTSDFHGYANASTRVYLYSPVLG